MATVEGRVSKCIECGSVRFQLGLGAEHYCFNCDDKVDLGWHSRGKYVKRTDVPAEVVSDDKYPLSYGVEPDTPFDVYMATYGN